MNKRLAFIWNNYCKQMDRYNQCMKANHPTTAKFHKERGDKILDSYFEELEKEIVD